MTNVRPKVEDQVTAQAVPVGKRRYQSPHLCALGSVATLTLGGASNPSPDGPSSRKNGP